MQLSLGLGSFLAQFTPIQQAAMNIPPIPANVKQAASQNGAGLSIGGSVIDICTTVHVCAALPKPYAFLFQLDLWSAGLLMTAIALDPIDSNYTIIPVVTPPGLAMPSGSVINPQITQAFRQALNIKASEVAYANALLTSINRAQGAAAANDAYWFDRQVAAASADAAKLQNLFRAEVLVDTSLQQLLPPLPAPTLSLDQVLAEQTSLQNQGFSADDRNLMTSLGLSAQQQADLLTQVVSRPATDIVAASQRPLTSLLDEDTLAPQIATLATGFQAWSQQTRNMNVESLKGGWAVGGDSQGGLILKTTDGQHWTTTHLPNAPLQAVSFANKTEGWVAGSTISHTADGGKSWNQQILPVSSASVSSLQFLSPSHGWAAGSQCAGPGPCTPLLLETTDGGGSWAVHNLPAVGAGGLSSVHFVDSSHGWLAGGNSILATADGGSTWVPETVPAYPFLDIRQVDFVDYLHGWAAGGPLLVTSDGGATWQIEQPPGFVESVSFIGPKLGWAAGAGPLGAAALDRSTDGGGTWLSDAPAPPAVVALTPASGTSGAEIQISGTGFDADQIVGVVFGSAYGTFEVRDSSTIVATAPDQATATFFGGPTVSVRVVGIGGSDSSGLTFSYTPPQSPG